jgi:hypothetical protein
MKMKSNEAVKWINVKRKWRVEIWWVVVEWNTRKWKVSTKHASLHHIYQSAGTEIWTRDHLRGSACSPNWAVVLFKAMDYVNKTLSHSFRHLRRAIFFNIAIGSYKCTKWLCSFISNKSVQFFHHAYIFFFSMLPDTRDYASDHSL